MHVIVRKSRLVRLVRVGDLHNADCEQPALEIPKINNELRFPVRAFFKPSFPTSSLSSAAGTSVLRKNAVTVTRSDASTFIVLQ